VGWLWIYWNNNRVWLAKVNPDEKKDIASGWITHNGELIISQSSL